LIICLFLGGFFFKYWVGRLAYAAVVVVVIVVVVVVGRET
jgi:hypothetical protein